MIKLNSTTADNTAIFKVAVLCYGNPSRGDDALAPIIYEQLIALFSARTDLLLVNDFQLQIEHILDLQQAERVLFVDAHLSCAAPFQFSALHVSEQLSHTSHALTPADLLGFYQQSLGKTPPPAYVLAIKGDSFGLGEPLTAIGQQNLQQAQAFISTLLSDCKISTWHSLISR